jgi:hypothetical protein
MPIIVVQTIKRGCNPTFVADAIPELFKILNKVALEIGDKKAKIRLYTLLMNDFIEGNKENFNSSLFYEIIGIETPENRSKLSLKVSEYSTCRHLEDICNGKIDKLKLIINGIPVYATHTITSAEVNQFYRKRLTANTW